MFTHNYPATPRELRGKFNGVECGGAKLRVVLADQNAIEREGLKLLLRRAKVEVVGEATEFEEVAPLVRRLKPDLLLLDARYLEGQDTNVLDAFRTNGVSTQVLLMAAPRLYGHLRPIAQGGMASILLRTATFEELLWAMQLTCRGYIVIHPRVVRILLEHSPKIPANTQQMMQTLSPRERTVLSMIAAGRPNSRIAGDLGISVRTAETHVRNVFWKLKVKSRLEAAVYYLWLGTEENRVISPANRARRLGSSAPLLPRGG